MWVVAALPSQVVEDSMWVWLSWENDRLIWLRTVDLTTEVILVEEAGTGQDNYELD